MGGKPFKVSKLAHQFRTELMMEHFGMKYDEVKDPIASRELTSEVIKRNSQTYFQIFRCEPDNMIKSF